MLIFPSIAIQYDSKSQITAYIVRYESTDRTNLFDGQMTVSAEEADLSNIFDVVREKIKRIIV